MLSCERKLTGTMKEESNESILKKTLLFNVLLAPLRVFFWFDKGKVAKELKPHF